MSDPKFLRASEAAARYAISRSTFYDWVSWRVLPAPRKLGCISLWDTAELDAIFEDISGLAARISEMKQRKGAA